jgi:S-DNA-T family DNA segregation ATPase FtsK/SpoIIIE
MPPAPQRVAALRLCLTTLGFAGCTFLWLALVTFTPADWPSQAVWLPSPALQNWGGAGGAWVAFQLFDWLGIGAYVVAGMLLLGVAAYGRNLPIRDPWLRFVGVLMLVGVASTSGALLPNAERLLAAFPTCGPGGALGVQSAAFFLVHLGPIYTLVLLACAALVGLLLSADELFFGVSRGIGEVGRRSIPVLARGGVALASAGASVAAAGVAAVSVRHRPQRPPSRSDPANQGERELEPDWDDDLDEAAAAPAPGRPARQAASALAEVDESEESPDAGESAPALDEDAVEPPSDAGQAPTGSRLPGALRVTDLSSSAAAARRGPAPARTVRRDEAGFVLPDLRLLGDPEPIDKTSIEILCREKAYVLEQTLNEFRLEVRVVAIETGPVITVFELRLAPGIKVSQIASLTNDMARALKAPAVRVVAPLPGKNTVGIEVPNVDKEKVRLKDLVIAAGERLDQHGLPLFLGKDASGQALVSDLSRMPHLLIAGTTGSGKSVCVSSVIMSLLLTRAPSEVQMILVDPKVVELAMFRDIPHLMCPIVTDVSKAAGILDWAATQMDERYALLAEAGVKDIRSYNRLGETGLRDRMQIGSEQELEAVPLRLPYIVIVIDELADLMMTSAKEVEFFLCRLAQKSRAVGIHLIVSTQRPQANVVTGLIKSNLPCRIAFRVASRLDSRIVLDQNGGEVLMGQGDMLFLPPGSSKLIRAQGTFVSDEELRDVVRHCRSQAQPRFHPELLRMPAAAAEAAGERDELFDQAVDIILESGRGSVSLLQRRLTIGYGRASRLVDQMYAAGIVGEYKGSQAREIIITKDEWNAIRNARDREETAVE